MTKTGIIGHRGAAGLALENSRDSIRAALAYAIDAIEFDVQRTLDGKLVVLHDAHTGRIADEKLFVHEKTLIELQALRLKNNQQLSTLEEILHLIGGQKSVVIDIKDVGCTDELLRILKDNPNVKADFTSLLDGELERLRRLRPELTICVRDRFNPFRILRTARTLHAEAISLNWKLINPITYYRARRRGLEVRVYTVNNPGLGRLLRGLYPELVLYTDHPERFTAKKKAR